MTCKNMGFKANQYKTRYKPLNMKTFYTKTDIPEKNKVFKKSPLQKSTFPFIFHTVS